jgi:chromosome segregation ATPase
MCAWRQNWGAGAKPTNGGSIIKPSTKTGTTGPSTKPTTGPTAIATPATGGAKKAALTVTTNSKSNALGVGTLVGEYEEIGTNHGKKVYKKAQEIPGHKNVKVFLYYWDSRDGPDSSGWWFGDQVGGAEVWARAVSSANLPPAAGWKVPWNAMKAEPGLLTVSPAKGAAAAPAASPAPPATKPAQPAVAQDARTKQATTKVNAVESATTALTTKAKALNKDSAPEALTKMQEALQKQQEKLTEAQKSLTTDITEARKAGPTGIASVTELSKLSPRIRTSITNVTAELNKIKALIGGSAKNAAETKKLEAQQKKEFDEALPAVTKAVSDAADAVEAVNTTAAPIIADTPEEPDEELKKTLTEIETAATAAQNKINECRQKINTKLTAARAWAPDARKAALAEFTSLQGKLGEEQKKLEPLKNLKRDFSKRVEAKKALKDITEKISDAELEVEKASMMTSGFDAGSQMSEEDVKTGEDHVKTAQAAVTNVTNLIDQKLKGASGPTKDELTSMRSKMGTSKTTLGKVSAVLKKQREGLSLQSVYETGHEKVDKAEEAMAKCAEAELPFLKGIEVLPEEESDKAIGECEDAMKEAQSAVGGARNFLSQKMSEIKKYSKETIAAATEELNELQKRCDVASKKLNAFKADTQERKVAAQLAEAFDKVSACEAFGKELKEAGASLTKDTVDDTSIESINETCEKTSMAEKACSTALNEARKLVSDKSNKSRDKDMQQGLSKLSNRLNAVQQIVSSMKKAVQTGHSLVKGKELNTEVDSKLTTMEAEVEQIDKQSKPEDAGLGVETISDELVMEICGKTAAFSKDLSTMRGQISTSVTTAPPAIKTLMNKLSDRVKVVATKINDIGARTKDQREKVLSASYVKECTAKTAEAESALEKVDEAEAPYLKGIEVVLEESKVALKACDDVAAAVQVALSAAKSLISSKQAELKKFSAANAKEALEEMSKLSERMNTVSQKLSVFKKDTESRKKTALLQEAGEKVKEVNAEIEKLNEFIAPLADKDPEAMSSTDAAATIKGLEELEHSAHQKLSETRNFVSMRGRDARDEKDKTTVKDLQSKLTDAQSALSKAKKDGSTHTEKIKAKALHQECVDKLKEAEAEVAKAKAACNPLLDEKGERFLVKASLATMATALRKYMADKDISYEKMWEEMAITQSKFVAFVGKMPESLERPECAFSEERRIAMYKSACGEDGKLSVVEFKNLFRREFLCVSEVSMTDVLDVATSKSLCKLQRGSIVESYEETSQTKEEGGLPRLKCKKVIAGEKKPEEVDAEGWVTTTSNNGNKYLTLLTPFSDFTKDLEDSLNTFTRNCNKIQNFFSQKARELGSAAKDTPLALAREELVSTGSKVAAVIKDLSALRKEVEDGKKAYHALELKEKNAHIEAKEQKQSDEITVVAKPAVDKMEAEFKKLEEMCKPLLDLNTDASDKTAKLLAFATPLSLTEGAAAQQAVVKTAVEEAKTVVKTQQAEELVAKAAKGPLLEGKKELQKWMSDASKILSASSKLMANLKSCCRTIAETQVEAVASALRKAVVSSGGSVEEYFAKVAGGEVRMTEDAFCQLIGKLDGLTLSAEHAKLVTRQIDSDGVGRATFMRVVQQFMKVVKEIAITPGFEIADTKEKMIRKAALDEILEVLDGPKVDETSSLERVKVKALSDGAEGWMTTKGNQGKVFLEKAEKPLYACGKDAPLGKEVKTGSEPPIRTLKAEEIVEILEGPCTETLQPAKRVKVKASSDGKIGYVTITDQHGEEFVEKDSKVYTCTATCAITDVFDITTCKVIKKMAVNDVFTITEGPVSEESSGVSRVKGKSNKDDTEGWVTVTGNAGTVFAKLNDKLMTVKKEVALLQKFGTDSPTVRMLAADESLEVLEPAKEEKVQPVERIKIRAASDGAVGWVTTKGAGTYLRKWTPTYKVLKNTSLCTTKGLIESVVREIANGEILQHTEGPVEVDGSMWVRGKMKKDGASGWALMKDEKGAKCLGQ